MQFFNPVVLSILTGAAITAAAPGNTGRAVPSPDISAGVGIITYSGTACDDTNQGTTLDYGGVQCVNWSNAGSFELQFGTLGGCANGNDATIEYFHNTGCAGSSYDTQTLGGGCYYLEPTSGGHGSGQITC